MRFFSATLIFTTLCWAAGETASAAPPKAPPKEKATTGQAGGDASRGKPGAARPSAPSDKTAKDATGGSLAERRAAAARQKVAQAAKRLFPRFDANRDQKLDDTEWTKAKAAIDKMVDAEVSKAAGNRRELVREALANMQRPTVQREGTDVSQQAVEQYAADLLAAATEAAENAQPAAAPVPPQAGRRAGSDGGDDPRRGRGVRPMPRGGATDAERAREEALRRRGLREENGRIVPIVPGRQGGDPRGGNGQGNGQRPSPPGGARP